MYTLYSQWLWQLLQIRRATVQQSNLVQSRLVWKKLHVV